MQKPITRWPLQKARFWQEMPFFRVLLPLILGIICYDRDWISFKDSWLIGSTLVTAALFITTAFLRRRPWGLQLFSFIQLQLFVFFLAVSLCSLQDSRHSRNWFGKQLNNYDAYLVKIAEQPKEQAKTIRAKVQLIAGIRGKIITPLSGNAFLSVYKNGMTSVFATGDTLVIPPKWNLIENSGNPYEYDYQTACRRNHIDAQAIIAPDEVLKTGNGNNNDIGWLERFHNWCDARLRYYLKDQRAYGLLQAMLLGDEHNFDPELRQAYSNTGIIHIVSISGSHVAVFFGAILFLLSWLKNKQMQVLKYILSVALVWLYVLMAGAPPSALRAAIMFSVFALAAIFNKEANPINTLMAAAFLLLCIKPYWLFAVGFQLSFGAVLSILLFYKPVYWLWPQTNWLPKLLWQAVSVSLAAEILTAPLVIYYFHNFPVFFLVANLAAAFIVGFCALIGGMLIILFAWWPFLAILLAKTVTGILLGFNWFIIRLQAWSPASFQWLYLNGRMLLFTYLAIGLLAISLLQRKKPPLFAGIGSACILLLLLIVHRWETLRQHRLVVYNSRQETLVERIDGPVCAVLNGSDSMAGNPAAKESHIAWEAWHTARDKEECMYLGGKKVLLLRHYKPGMDSTDFPVDVLIVLQTLKGLSVSNIKERFHPAIIVAGNDQKRWVLERWRDSCKANNIPFHATGVKGAFVLE